MAGTLLASTRAVLLSAVIAIVAAGCSGSHHSTASGTTTTSVLAPTRVARPTKDILLIRRLFEYLNEQDRISPRQGLIAQSEFDYYANAGRFTSFECVDYWMSFDNARLRREIVPIEPTIHATPKWLDDGVHPAGRVYAVTLRETFTWPGHRLPDGRVAETETHVAHVTVMPGRGVGDNAFIFVPCEPIRSA